LLLRLDSLTVFFTWQIHRVGEQRKISRFWKFEQFERKIKEFKVYYAIENLFDCYYIVSRFSILTFLPQSTIL
jgi:hypothetical protein